MGGIADRAGERDSTGPSGRSGAEGSTGRADQNARDGRGGQAPTGPDPAMGGSAGRGDTKGSLGKGGQPPNGNVDPATGDKTNLGRARDAMERANRNARNGRGGQPATGDVDPALSSHQEDYDDDGRFNSLANLERREKSGENLNEHERQALDEGRTAAEQASTKGVFGGLLGGLTGKFGAAGKVASSVAEQAVDGAITSDDNDFGTKAEGAKKGDVSTGAGIGSTVGGLLGGPVGSAFGGVAGATVEGIAKGTLNPGPGGETRKGDGQSGGLKGAIAAFGTPTSTPAPNASGYSVSANVDLSNYNKGLLSFAT
ncbi:hypothetical protein [Hahella ganghwensis]|uniref:hypothetical protein n=1 Tax=Hahella ganghwensis TaxID=286420 RepID=UPI0003789BBE|nr:hypothetical protein [Hahella ganghwensis]